MDQSKIPMIIVCGAGGRMGGRIIHAIHNSDNIRLAAGVEIQDHIIFERGLAQHVGIAETDVPLADDLKEVIDLADVIIDFTTPTASLSNLQVAREFKKGLVVGTTGLTKEQEQQFVNAGTEIPICLSPNMSIGVNLLFSIVEIVAKALGTEYEPEIIEIHHHLKKDAPSGTAMQLARILAEARGWDINKAGVFGRKGFTGERKPEEIGIHAVRVGDVVGEHTVIFGGSSERIELIHRAHSRDIFAFGAVNAAIFIANARPGYYNMKDVLDH